MGILGLGSGAAETGLSDFLKEGVHGVVSGAATTAGSELAQTALTSENADATPGEDSGVPSGTDNTSSLTLVGSVVDTAEHAAGDVAKTVGDVAKGAENGVSGVGKAIGDVFKSIF